MVKTKLQLNEQAVQDAIIDQALTVNDIVEKSGLAQMTVYNILRKGYVTTASAKKLATGLSLDVHDILDLDAHTEEEEE